MKSKVFIMVVLYCVVCQCFISECISAQDTVGYIKEIIVSIPWGSGPGEVGKTEGYYSSPPSFTVDENGCIYLLDSVNKRILVANPKGNIIDYYSLNDGYSYIKGYMSYYTDEQRIYIHIANDKMFFIYNKKGVLEGAIQYNELIGSRFIIDNDLIVNDSGYISLNESSIDTKTGEGGETVEIRRIQHDEEIELVFSKGLITNVLYESENQQLYSGSGLKLVFPDNSSKILRFQMIPKEYDVHLLCETINEESIFLALPSPLTDYPTLLLKFNNKQEFIGIIEDELLLPRSSFRVEKPIETTDTGEIYTIILDTDGIKIIKWTFR